MATQTNNLLIIESGVTRTLDAANDALVVGPVTTFSKSLAVGEGLTVTGDTSITGDLNVSGSIISRDTENVIVRDAFLDLAFGNTTTVAEAGGLTVSMNRNSGFSAGNVTAFVAGVGGTSAPTFTYANAGSSTALVAGDIVAITGASDANNDGLYVVASVSGNTFPQTVTIKGIGGSAPSGSVPFVQNQFTAGTAQTATAFKLDLAVAAFADGTSSFKDPNGVAWEKGLFVTAYVANATESAFEANGAYDTAAQTSLQEAYVTGNTITTSNTEGDVVIGGTEKLDVTATGGVSISNTLDLNGAMDADVTTYDVNASGAYTMVAGAASSLSTSAGDLTLDAQAASLILDGGEGAADAVRIVASNAAGGIDIDAGTAGIAVDSTGAISLGAVGASDFTVDGDLTLESTNTGITDIVSAVEVQVTTALFDVNASGAVLIEAGATSDFSVNTGDLSLSAVDGEMNIYSSKRMAISTDTDHVYMDAHLGVHIGAIEDSDFTVVGAGFNLTLESQSGSTYVYGGEAVADAVKIEAKNAAGGIDINAGSAGITVDTTGALSMQAAASSDLTLAANSAGTVSLAIAASNTGAGVADLDIDADGAITMDAGAGMSLDAGAASNFSVTGANLTVSTITSGVIAMTSAGNIEIDAVGTLEINSSGAAIGIGNDGVAQAINVGTGAAARTITVGNATGATALDFNAGTGGVTVDTTSGGAISLDAIGAASNFSVSGANLTLETVTSGDLVLNAAAAMDVNVTSGLTVDAGAGISLDAADNSNFTVLGSGKSLVIEADGGGAQRLVLASAGTGLDAVRVHAVNGGMDIDAAGGITVDAAGALSMQAADTSDLTLAANSAGAVSLTIDASNAGAGSATVILKAEEIVEIGASAYTGAQIKLMHFTRLVASAGIQGVAGENLVLGDAVVAKWDAVNNAIRYYKAANNAGTDVERNVFGVAFAAANTGANVQLQTVPGAEIVTALAGLTSADLGKPVYLGTGGALSLTAPTTSGTSVFRVGFVSNHTAAKVLFQPQFLAKII